jgi:hypothetical protein
MMCFLQAVQHAQQALQAAESSGQQQSSMVPPNIALIALLLSARCVHSEADKRDPGLYVLVDHWMCG